MLTGEGRSAKIGAPPVMFPDLTWIPDIASRLREPCRRPGNPGRTVFGPGRRAKGNGVAKSGKSKANQTVGKDHAAAAPLTGPCLTCNNSPTCVYRRQRGYDVISCELYDGYAVPAERTVNLGPKPGARRRPPPSEPLATERPEGLCVNCGRAGDCHLPRPAGGVWHCLEYT